MKISIILFLISVSFLPSCMKGKKADVVFHNAKIFSFNQEKVIENEALAILNKKVIELGPERQILNKYRYDESIDLRKKTVMPVLIDTDCKLFKLLQNQQALDLSNLKSKEDAITRIEKHIQKKRLNFIFSSNFHIANKTLQKDILNSIRTSFPTKEFLLNTTDLTQAFHVYDNRIQLLNGVDQTLLLNSKNEFDYSSSDFFEIQNQLLEKGIVKISVHDVTYNEYIFLKKMEKSSGLIVQIDVYLKVDKDNLALLKLKPVRKSKIKIKGCSIKVSEDFDACVQQCKRLNKQVSFSSQNFDELQDKIAKQLSTFTTDHRWILRDVDLSDKEIVTSALQNNLMLSVNYSKSKKMLRNSYYFPISIGSLYEDAFELFSSSISIEKILFYTSYYPSFFSFSEKQFLDSNEFTFLIKENSKDIFVSTVYLRGIQVFSID